MRFRPKAFILTMAVPGEALGLGVLLLMKSALAGPLPPFMSVVCKLVQEGRQDGWDVYQLRALFHPWSIFGGD